LDATAAEAMSYDVFFVEGTGQETSGTGEEPWPGKEQVAEKDDGRLRQ
jgi:hypothetical protein